MIPTAKSARIMAIGETFFLSSQQQSSVSPTAAMPGISWSRFCWSVVTFSAPKPLAPRDEYWVRASLIPSAPEGSLSQSI